LSKYDLVAEVDAVEVADGGDGGDSTLVVEF
jgi:hypothetical protein